MTLKTCHPMMSSIRHLAKSEKLQSIKSVQLKEKGSIFVAELLA
jgi:hypothetical protein